MAKRSRRKKRKTTKQQSAVSLPEGLLVEMLARVPYRSLCRCKCVSRSWLALCSDSDLRKRSPQTLSGFFWFAPGNDGHRLRFRNLSVRGRPLVDADLSLLGRGCVHGFVLVDCCSSLLLCRCFQSLPVSSLLDADYVVCDPVTEKWTVLPQLQHPMNIQWSQWTRTGGEDLEENSDATLGGTWHGLWFHVSSDCLRDACMPCT